MTEGLGRSRYYSMRIHLVTYATPRFRLRQWVLGASARMNHIVDTVASWTPDSLRAAGFEERCKDINLSERGSGFWAWKPFVIGDKLANVPDGDLVIYCDVGRLYPFKLLDQPVDAYVNWMDERGQDIMPGIEIPWDGPNSAWVKREAFLAMNMDLPKVHSATPVQASFSLWRASASSRSFVANWLDLCSKRPLISDDPSRGDIAELADYRGHRHDQALLTLCCIKGGISGLDLGVEKPPIDTRHPSQVSRFRFGEVSGGLTLSGRLLRAILRPVEKIEQGLRHKVKFGGQIHE